MHSKKKIFARQSSKGLEKGKQSWKNRKIGEKGVANSRNHNRKGCGWGTLGMATMGNTWGGKKGRAYGGHKGSPEGKKRSCAPEKGKKMREIPAERRSGFGKLKRKKSIETTGKTGGRIIKTERPRQLHL